MFLTNQNMANGTRSQCRIVREAIHVVAGPDTFWQKTSGAVPETCRAAGRHWPSACVGRSSTCQGDPAIPRCWSRDSSTSAQTPTDSSTSGIASPSCWSPRHLNVGGRSSSASGAVLLKIAGSCPPTEQICMAFADRLLEKFTRDNVSQFTQMFLRQPEPRVLYLP
jgi:hypothetical protein